MKIENGVARARLACALRVWDAGDFINTRCVWRDESYKLRKVEVASAGNDKCQAARRMRVLCQNERLAHSFCRSV